MSGSSYPQGLDSFVPVADGDLITAALENQQTDAIMAIESTLGLDPGSGGTVAQALAGKLDRSGGSMGGDIAMASHRVTGLAAPSSAQDAATKAYVDSSTSGINPMTSSGDTLYGGTSGALSRLPGDISGTRKFLREQAVDGVAQAPAWDSLQAGDIPVVDHSRISDFDSQVRSSRLDQMAAPSADIPMAGHRLTGLADPSSAQDAATKAYVLSQGFAMAATTTTAGTYTKLTVNSQGLVTEGTAASVADISGAAAVSSPTFTGVPAAPTAAAGTSSTQLATTEFVHNALVAALPAGVIVPYGGTAAPAGWVLCDGSTFNGTQAAYQALWSVIGTTYGGSGQSSFKVPDLRGRVPIGAGTATGATGATSHAIGSSGGEETHQLSSQEMPSHTHTATATDAGHAHGNIPLYASSSSGDNLTWNPGAPRIWPNGNASTTTGYAAVSVTNASTGGSGNHNNMPPYLAINYLMKL